MDKPEIKVVYWNHGRYASDLQDQVFDEVLPEFFENDALNVLGIEDGGNYTDLKRDEKMAGVLKKPFAIESYIAAPDGYGPDAVIGLIVSYVFQTLSMRGGGSLLGREKMMLCRWNKLNPRKKAALFVESFRDESERQRFSASTDELAITRRMIGEVGKFSKGDLLREVKRMEVIYRANIVERNLNWVRVIKDFIETMAVSNPTRIKILLTIGSDHFELTKNLRSELGDRVNIREDLVLRVGDFEKNGKSDRIKSEEEVLRNLLFNMLRSRFELFCQQEPSSFYSVDRDKLKDLARYVDELSMAELCEKLGVRMDDALSTDEQLFEDEFSNETTLEKLEQERGGIDVEDMLIDRSSHPNNLFIDVVFVTAVVSMILGIGREEDEFNLLGNVIESILPSVLSDFRKEAYGYTQNFMDGHGEISDSLPLMVQFLAFIAKQDPVRSKLWGVNSGKLESIQSLIRRARALFTSA